MLGLGTLAEKASRRELKRIAKSAKVSYVSPFVITIKTTKEMEPFLIQATPDPEMVIAWGDDSAIDVWRGASPVHTYKKPGRYNIFITGGVKSISFESCDNIINIVSWGGIKWKSLSKTFLNCKNLRCSAKGGPSLEGCCDISHVFRGSVLFDGDIGSWQVDNVRDASYAFMGCELLDPDISRWNVGSMSYLARFLEGTSFSKRNFEKLVIAWSKQKLQMNVSPCLSVPGGISDRALSSMEEIISRYRWVFPR